MKIYAFNKHVFDFFFKNTFNNLSFYIKSKIKLKKKQENLKQD